MGAIFQASVVKRAQPDLHRSPHNNAATATMSTPLSGQTSGLGLSVSMQRLLATPFTIDDRKDCSDYHDDNSGNEQKTARREGQDRRRTEGRPKQVAKSQ